MAAIRIVDGSRLSLQYRPAFRQKLAPRGVGKVRLEHPQIVVAVDDPTYADRVIAPTISSNALRVGKAGPIAVALKLLRAVRLGNLLRSFEMSYDEARREALHVHPDGR